jgi:hypothetical protein
MMPFDLKNMYAEEVLLILNALGEMPVKISGRLYTKLENQLRLQQENEQSNTTESIGEK